MSYLGVPVHSPDGETLGALCAIGTEPRHWSDEDIATMLDLAAVVESELILRDRISLSEELALSATRVLAHESIIHRVKNALAVASSLVVLSGRKPSRFKRRFQRHKVADGACESTRPRLIDQCDHVDLADLATRRLLPYAQPGTVADVGGPPVSLRQNQISPICLLLHELATNSAKYGAFNNEGSVSVRWSADQQVKLVWEEVSTTISPDVAEGFGTRLIKTAVAQLGGKLDTDWGFGRFRVRIEFPV